MSIPRFLEHRIILAVVLGVIISPAISSSAEKPLKANFVTQELVGFKPECPSKFGGTMTGKGNSTHLGKTLLNGGDCITPVEDYYRFEGKLTLTAANGDKLTGDYAGSFTPSGKGSMYNLTGAKFHITGGTRRFSKASGTADLTGEQDILTGKGKVEANGTVKY
jgi:hypothetical protein